MRRTEIERRPPDFMSTLYAPYLRMQPSRRTGRFPSRRVGSSRSPAQPGISGFGNPEAIQQAQGIVIEEAPEVLAADVEGGDRRQDHRAGEDQPPHVLDVDEAVGRLAEPEHQR